MMGGASPRGIIREKRFERELEAMSSNVKRIDEAFEYLDIRLGSDPRSGVPSSVPGIWVAPIRIPGDAGIVRASLFYTFTDTHVYYQSIRLAL
jgi:hypothetical protein